jgi:hypothetical protein
VLAHHWLDELTRSPNQTIESLAAREGKTERWIRRTISLAFLSPALVKAAIDGRLPRGFGVKRLMGLRKCEPFAISLISPAAQSGTQNSASETHFRVRRPRPVVPAE